MKESRRNVYLLNEGIHMTVIYYNPASSDCAERLQKILIAETKGDLEIYGSIDRFLNRLLQPDFDSKIAVVVICTPSEIYRICSLKKIINDVRVILILPDRSSETLSAAYRLHPRFIAYADSDLQDVALILRRMILLQDQRSVPKGTVFTSLLSQKKTTNSVLKLEK
jgi:hypothetical protein